MLDFLIVLVDIFLLLAEFTLGGVKIQEGLFTYFAQGDSREMQNGSGL